MQNTPATLQNFSKKPELKFLDSLYKKFPKAEVYLVGGLVRDLFLNRESKDIDLVVRGVSINNLITFLKKQGKCNLVGRVFGVIKFIPKGFAGAKPGVHPLEAIDIALPRKEHSLGTGGYRDFKVQASAKLKIEDDLSRRDFTINAMAWDLRNNNLIDLFGGLADLKNKKIRTVGKPAERFAEDYSRLLRALRFAVTLNFDLETQTAKVVTSLMPKINSTIKVKGKMERVVPEETMAREFLKSLVKEPAKTLEFWHELSAIKQILPELLPMKGCEQPLEFHSEGDVWAHTVMALENTKSKKFSKFFGTVASPQIILTTLLHDIGKPPTKQTPEKDGVDRVRFNGHDAMGAAMASKIMKRLRFSSVPEFTINDDAVVWLIQHHLLSLNNPKDLRATTIEKYFFNPNLPGRELLELTFCDGSASLSPKGTSSMKSLKGLIKRIEAIGLPATPASWLAWRAGEWRKGRVALPDPILNGNEIMKLLKMKPGPQVGKLILHLREAQLSNRVKTKSAAKRFLHGIKIRQWS